MFGHIAKGKRFLHVGHNQVGIKFDALVNICLNADHGQLARALSVNRQLNQQKYTKRTAGKGHRNARFALQRMARDIRMAGAFGCLRREAISFADPAIAAAFALPISVSLEPDGTLRSLSLVGVQGGEAGGPPNWTLLTDCLSTAQVRALRDRSDLFEDGGNVIRLGPRHRFSVNTQPLDLTLIPRGDTLAVHLTGTDYLEPLHEPSLDALRAYWNVSLESESPSLYRGEYLACRLLDDALAGEGGLRVQALEHALQLEWVRDNTPLAPSPEPAAGPANPNDTPATLPDELREDLTRLARSGQAAALRERLRRARGDLPGHAATLALLQASADRFDFETLAHHLREPEEGTL